MAAQASRSDEQLLLSARADADAFGGFYTRYEGPVLGFFLTRVRDPETAADLTAEVFAAALLGVERFRPSRGSARGWLFGIARNTYAMYARSQAVDARARRRLGWPPLALSDDTLERIASDAGELKLQALDLLRDLPDRQREAVEARIVREERYTEIAQRTDSTEAAVRQRVSRGLATLRSKLGGAP